LIADLSLLPALLISLDKDGKEPVSKETDAELNSSIKSKAAN